MRYLRVFLVGALILLLGVMLLVAIYLTQFDLRWLAFFAGVLFAAIPAKASQAVQAKWRVAQVTKQLQRAKNALETETA